MGVMDLFSGKLEGPLQEGMKQFTALLTDLKNGINAGLGNDTVIYNEIQEIKMLLEERIARLESAVSKMRDKESPVETSKETAQAAPKVTPVTESVANAAEK